MKNYIFSISFILCVALVQKSSAQFSFGVSPGLGFNSAYFGYKFGNIVPFIGFQHYNINFNGSYADQSYEFDPGTGSYVLEDNTYSADVRANLYIPNIGVKVFFSELNDIKAYGSLCISKPFARGTAKVNGTEEEELSEQLKKLSFWGGELGFGVEYFFSGNFSLGGEFGLRLLTVNYEETRETEIFNPNTGGSTPSEVTTDLSFSTNPTYSRISLNYYFE